jgi:hypothetical protein
MARGVGGRGPANIMKHMKGIHFPIDKDGILDHVKNGPGPDTNDVVDVLNKIENKKYNSPAEILKEVGKIK